MLARFLGVLFITIFIQACGGNDKKPQASVSDLEQAKSAVQEVRRWSTQLRELSDHTVTLDAENQSKFKSAAYIGKDQVGQNLTMILEAMLRAYRAYHLDTAAAPYKLIDYISSFPGEFPALNATGDILIDTQAGTLSLSSGASISQDGVHYDNVRANISVPTTTFAKTFTVTVNSFIVENDLAIAEISKGTANLVYESDTDIFSNFGEANIPLSVSLILELSMLEKAEMFDNAMAFVGRQEFTSVKYKVGGVEGLNAKHILLSGQISNERNEYLSGSFEADMRNADLFTPLAPTSDGAVDPKLIRYVFSDNRNTMTLNFADPQQNVVYEYMPLEVGGNVRVTQYGQSYLAAGGSNGDAVFPSFENFLSTHFETSGIKHFMINNVGVYRVQMPSPYALEEGYISGTLLIYNLGGESADMWRDFDGQIIARLKLAGLPEASFTFKVDRSSYDTYQGSVEIKYDKVSIQLLANSIAVLSGNPPTSTSIELRVTVSNPGSTTVLVIKPDMNRDTLFGTITVNGQQVATIEEQVTKNMYFVTFSDASFETLNF